MIESGSSGLLLAAESTWELDFEFMVGVERSRVSVVCGPSSTYGSYVAGASSTMDNNATRKQSPFGQIRTKRNTGPVDALLRVFACHFGTIVCIHVFIGETKTIQFPNNGAA